MRRAIVAPSARLASSPPPDANAETAAMNSNAISAIRPACSTLAAPRSPSSLRRATAATLGSDRLRVARRLGRFARRAAGSRRLVTNLHCMEGSGFNIFGDPDELRARLEELAEQAQSSQKVAWADHAIRLAVEMTVAAINRLDLTGSSDEQAGQVRDAVRVGLPEALPLVPEGREGLGP